MKYVLYVLNSLYKFFVLLLIINRTKILIIERRGKYEQTKNVLVDHREM